MSDPCGPMPQARHQRGQSVKNPWRLGLDSRQIWGLGVVIIDNKFPEISSVKSGMPVLQHETVNQGVVGSSPTSGAKFFEGLRVIAGPFSCTW